MKTKDHNIAKLNCTPKVNNVSCKQIAGHLYMHQEISSPSKFFHNWVHHSKCMYVLNKQMILVEERVLVDNCVKEILVLLKKKQSSMLFLARGKSG